MIWNSWTDFWAMGGYGVYVWGSMGVTFGLLLVEVVQAVRAQGQVLAQLRAERALMDLPSEDVL
jgi:heme exporter protein D